MKTSNKFSLNLNDFSKGLLVAVGGAVFTVLGKSIEAGSLSFDWKAICSVALAAGISYLTKNFFTPAQTVTPVK